MLLFLMIFVLEIVNHCLRLSMVISPNLRCTEELPRYLLPVKLPVISELFESVLLSLYGSCLHSDHLQFGFKANSGFNDAMFTFIKSATY